MTFNQPVIGGWYVSTYEYNARRIQELSFPKDFNVQVINEEDGWWYVRTKTGQEGTVPGTFFVRSHEFYAVAIYSYIAQLSDELSISVREKIHILDKADDGWWYGTSGEKEGWFPHNFVKEIISDPNKGFSKSNMSEIDKTSIHGVRALFNFDTGNPDELSFCKGEQMDVINKPSSDPEWWEAIKADGSIGLIPTTYVEVIEKLKKESGNHYSVSNVIDSSIGSDDINITSQTFYHKVSRDQAVTILMKQGQFGDFLVRESNKDGFYSISVRAPDRVRHFQIEITHGNYTIGPRSFCSFQQLIEYYSVQPILTSASGEKYTLKNGISS